MPGKHSFNLTAHVHSPGQVRRAIWNGRKNAKQSVVSVHDFLRAGVLSSLSTKPDEPTLRLEGEIRAAQFIAAFERDAKGNPHLRRSYANALRDASRTGRVADFGQAVSWVVAQQHLGLPFLVDYERFCSAVSIPSEYTAKRPDYVAFDAPGAKKFALVEGKGRWYPDRDRSTPADWRAALAEAQAQGEVGFEHLANRPLLGYRGIEAVVSIAALAHSTGSQGIVAQVTRDERTVSEWELSATRWRAIYRLIYGAWGMAAGGERLARVLRGADQATNELSGRRFDDGEFSLWLPDGYWADSLAPFSMAAAIEGAGFDEQRPRHAISAQALRLAVTGEGVSHEEWVAWREGSIDTDVRRYGDGTALVGDALLRRLPRCSLPDFLHSIA
jgi:hypothetical protein